jgi:uncharacterized protein involved in outer membrane biogenesis
MDDRPLWSQAVLKKILLAVLAGGIVLFAGAFFWARSVLTGDNVRAALAAQVEQAIGQPVAIGDISVGIMPRLTVKLGEVKIGRPERVVVGELQVGTDFRALLSRRIEHASLHLSGARIELPLPPFSFGSASASSTGDDSSAPVELVSIDEVVLKDVQVVSGGRTLRGDIEVVPQGRGVLVRRIALAADQTTLSVTGQITDLAGPTGELTMKAAGLDLDRLLAFVNDFTAAAGLPATTGAARSAAPAGSGPAAPGMNLALAIDAHSAQIGGLTLSQLNGKARLTGRGLSLDPVSFGIFDGRYQGSLALTMANETVQFRGSSTLSSIDVAAASAFGGSPATITGRLSGRLDFSGRGSDAAAVMKTVKGRGRVDIVDGVIKNLGLINAVVVATSMRAGSLGQATSQAQSSSSDEPFSRLGATFDIANGTVSTPDLVLESKDVILNAQGTVGLVSSTVNLKGRVQLSDTLSQQAGRDLVRYTQDQGRVTLPASVTGTIDAPSVHIDVADMAERALQNAADEQKERAKQEATKAIDKKLGGFFGR